MEANHYIELDKRVDGIQEQVAELSKITSGLKASVTNLESASSWAIRILAGVLAAMVPTTFNSISQLAQNGQPQPVYLPQPQFPGGFPYQAPLPPQPPAPVTPPNWPDQGLTPGYQQPAGPT